MKLTKLLPLFEGTDNEFTNKWADSLYYGLNHMTGDAQQTVNQWIAQLKKTDRFTDAQLKDLTKDALAMLPTSGGSRYKQLIKGKLLTLLNGKPIR